MSFQSENFGSYVSLVIYTVFGAIIRYFINPFCFEGLEGITFVIGFAAIVFLIIGIVSGLYSFIRQGNNLSRIARGIVTGFAVGFGGMTIISLLFITCI